MLTNNPRIRKEVNHLADRAESTVRQIRHAARDTTGPGAGEVGALIAQLEQTLEVLGREGSSEAVQAGRRLHDRSHALADQLKSRARERVGYAVHGVQQRVVESPLKALGIAAAAGAFVALLLAASGRARGD